MAATGGHYLEHCLDSRRRRQHDFRNGRPSPGSQGQGRDDSFPRHASGRFRDQIKGDSRFWEPAAQAISHAGRRDHGRFDKAYRYRALSLLTDDGKGLNVSHYTVKFFKTLINDTGREFETCQGSFETHAVDKMEAVALAKYRFCQEGRLRDWSMHADRFEVLDVELPS